MLSESQVLHFLVKCQGLPIRLKRNRRQDKLFGRVSRSNAFVDVGAFIARGRECSCRSGKTRTYSSLAPLFPCQTALKRGSRQVLPNTNGISQPLLRTHSPDTKAAAVSQFVRSMNPLMDDLVRNRSMERERAEWAAWQREQK